MRGAYHGDGPLAEANVARATALIEQAGASGPREQAAEHLKRATDSLPPADWSATR